MSRNTEKLNAALRKGESHDPSGMHHLYPGNVQPAYVSPQATQRIRDLERELAEVRRAELAQFDRARDLEREVERLKAQVEFESSKAVVAVADRADAERFRWLVVKHSTIDPFYSRIHWQGNGYEQVRGKWNFREVLDAAIDADRAKEAGE